MSVPSLNRQKRIIIDNTDILDEKTKLTILSLVMMNVGPTVVKEVGKNRGTDIDLDEVAKLNPEIITHIYNIVITRREVLNRPAIV
jgi:hypothetical protein